jgi:hypothetical protein
MIFLVKSYNYWLVRNNMVMDQPILFHRSNKKNEEQEEDELPHFSNQTHPTTPGAARRPPVHPPVGVLFSFFLSGY